MNFGHIKIPKKKLREAQVAFTASNKFWKCKTISIYKITIIFYINVNSAFLYGEETWYCTDINRIQIFINNYKYL